MPARSMPGLASSLVFPLPCLEISQLESEMNIGSSDDILKNIPLSYEDLEVNSVHVCIIFSH